MIKQTFAFYDKDNGRYSNEFLYHNLNAQWYNNFDSFLKDESNNKFYYIWENELKSDANLIEKLPKDILLYNKIKIFLDISTGEINTKYYTEFAEKIKNYGAEHFVIHVNTQFEFDTVNALFDNQKPLVFFSNRNEIHFYENLMTSKRPKRFLLLCRRFSINRLFIFLDLHKRGILENTHFTFGTYQSVYGTPNYDTFDTDTILTNFYNRFCYEMDNSYVKDIVQYGYDNRKIFDSLPKFVGNGFSDQNPYQIANFFNESYISLLIESKLNNDDNIYHPTEKLMKCFYYKHPFVVYSTPKFLEHTKRSGYKTFDVLNENYDTIPYYIDRIKFINDYVEALNAMDESKFISLYNNCLPNVYHNHNILTNKMKNFFSEFRYNQADSTLSDLFQGKIEFKGFKEV